ncbi:MAG: CDP-alcohol phosphatidyltransferase family protein, partial [Planctomycetota bacterium]
MPSLTPRPSSRTIRLLPNALTLANAGLGLLAISKAIDALALGQDPAAFESNLEAACWLVLAAGVFDALDGKVARLTNSLSPLGAQLDSLADALTFGVAPAIIAKVLLEHAELAHTRIHFAAAAAFSLMAILRLARFNAETDDDDDHSRFRGLPTPAAAGTLVATILLFLSVRGSIEGATAGVQPTLFGRALEACPVGLRETVGDTLLLPLVLGLLPLLALLMVSRVQYVHLVTRLGSMQGRGALVGLVFAMLGLFLVPVPFLFLFGLGYVGSGLFGA